MINLKKNNIKKSKTNYLIYLLWEQLINHQTNLVIMLFQVDQANKIYHKYKKKTIWKRMDMIIWNKMRHMSY